MIALKIVGVWVVGAVFICLLFSFINAGFDWLWVDGFATIARVLAGAFSLCIALFYFSCRDLNNDK